ncbi:MAG: hypothetical protein CME36_07020 [unclassified Hahellaceae]|nr:hypothetical protein [Hahellaceae bacterium]
MYDTDVDNASFSRRRCVFRRLSDVNDVSHLTLQDSATPSNNYTQARQQYLHFIFITLFYMDFIYMVRKML